MKPYLIIISCILFLVSCKHDSIDNKDKRNENWAWWVDASNPNGEWVPNNADSSDYNDKTTVNDKGSYTLFYFNGNIRKKGKIKFGKRIDTVYGYNLNGQLETYTFIFPLDESKFYFINDGYHKMYFPNGKIEGEGIIKNHVFGQGSKWTQYFQNGEINETVDFTKDTGWFTHYYENGQIKDSVFYIKGVGKFITKVWYKNGTPAKIADWKFGNWNGLNITYYENGQLEDSCTMVNGKHEGKAIGRYENGKIKFIETYKNGTFEGKATNYYENGKIKGTANFENGVPDGEHKEYDQNGKVTKNDVYKDGVIIKKNPT